MIRNRARYFLLVCLAPLFLSCSGYESGGRSSSVHRRGQILFVSDFSEGRRLADAQGMPCLVFFTAEWCTYCHQMEELAFGDPHVAELAGNFICIVVDADRYPKLCRDFAVTGFPTIQFVSSNGSMLHRLVGRQSAVDLAQGMRAALKRYAWLRDAGTAIR